MTAPTKLLRAPPSGITYPDPGILRPRSDITWSGEVGNVDIRFQWDTDSGFGGSVDEVVDVDVGGATGGTFSLTFNGQTTQPLDFDVPIVAVNEIQTLFNGATGGTFHIDFDGQGPTADIDFDAVASAVKAALEGLSNIDNVSVTGAGTSGDPWIITFDGAQQAGKPIPELTTDDTNLTGGTPTSTIATTTQGKRGLTKELEDLSGIHKVTVTGSGTGGDPWQITQTDPINGGRNIPDMTGTDIDLSGGTGLTVTVSTQGSAGPPIDILVFDDAGNAFDQAPDADLGLAGPHFWRVAVVDRDDGEGTFSAAQTLNYKDPIDYRRYLYNLVNVGVGFDYQVVGNNLGDSPNERFLVWNDATGGDFTLTHDSNVTAAIGFDAAASLIESELEGLASITAVRVTKVTLGSGVRGWDVEILIPGNSPQTVTVQDAGLTGDTIGGLDELQPGGVWGTGGTAGPDGDGIEFRRYLYNLVNVGIGFHTTDEPVVGWGTGSTEGPDGDIRDDFFRYLYNLVNVDDTQPCPFLFSLSATVIEAGDGLTVFGQGFGDNSAPDFGAEVRLYETPDFAAPFILLPIVTITDGDVLDTIAVTIPGSVTASGFVAVVHTITPTCDSSNFIFLTVLPAGLDPDAGWWIEAWTEDGNAKVIDTIDVISASFQPVLNGVGGGVLVLSADYSRLDEIIIPDPRDSNGDPLPPYNSLIRVFLHGVEQYAFYAENLDTKLKDQADNTIRITGAGIESSLTWANILPANHPAAVDTALLDHLYGSSLNLLENGNLEDGKARLGNLGFEIGDVDPWTPEPLGGEIVADNTVSRTGAWSGKISPDVQDGGAGVDLTVVPGDRIFFESYVSELGATGDDVTLIAYRLDEDDNEVILDSAVVTLAAGWKLGALEFTVPGELTSVRIAWRFTDANPVHDFFVDDNFEAGDITPWVAKGSADIALSDTENADGRFSLEVTPSAFGDGARHTFVVNPGQTVSLSIAVSGPAGDQVRLRAIIDGVQVTDSVTLTGVPSFDVLAINGIPGATEQTLLLEIFTLETGGFAPFFADVASVVAGEVGKSGGGIFLDLLALAQARGIISSFTTDFTTTVDSKGETWDEPSLSTQVRRSTSLLDLAKQLSGYGLDWKVTPQKGIQFFNSLGSDLTVMDDAPVLTNGRGVDGGKVSRAIPKITRVFAEGAGGIWTTKSNSADEVGIEPKEKYLAATSALDATALDRAATSDLDAANARQSAIRIDLVPESGVLPFFDFIVGDTIFVDLHDEDGGPLVTIEQYPEGFRVIGISVQLTAEEPHYTIDLNWMVLEEMAARDAALRVLQERGNVESVSPGASLGEDPLGGGTLIFPSAQDHKHKSVDITDLDALAEGDPAGGDLVGVYPNPNVNGIRGIPFATGSPSEGDAPLYDSSSARLNWGKLPSGKATRTADQSIADVTEETVDWDNEEYDDNDFVDVAGGNPERISIPDAGRYAVTVQIPWASGTGRRIIRLREGGSTFLAASEVDWGTASAEATQLVWEGSLAASDFLEVLVFQSSGGSLNITDATYEASISVRRVG